MRRDKTKRVAETIRVIWPSPAIEAWYRGQLDSLITQMFLDFSESLPKAWRQADLPTVAQDTAADVIRRAMERWGNKWVKRFNEVSAEIAAGFADRSKRYTENSMRTALADAGFTVKFKPSRKILSDYKAVIGEQVGLIKSIPQQYITQVQGDVWRTVTTGSDLAALSKKLSASYGSTIKRAALISLDQNAKAKATFERTRRLELGITEAIWQHSAAGKEPRPTHVAMTGERFSVAKGNYDPDPRVLRHIQPGELIRCRCGSRGCIPGFET